MLPTNFPNFLIIGAGKAGTTSLFYYLRQHPEVFMPPTKEIRFFVDDEIYLQGIKKYTAIHFKNAEKYPLRGEATPTYFHFPVKVIPRIKEIYRDKPPKFIVVLRDPVSRAYSHYLHMYRTAVETESFQKALEYEQERIQKDPAGWWGYFSDGLYAALISTWIEAFPHERFHFLLTEDLSSNPQKALADIFRFLGVVPEEEIDYLSRKNIAGRARSVAFMQFLNEPSLLKSFFKAVFPPHTRTRIKVKLRALNLDRRGQKVTLDSHFDRLLRQRYRSDIENLEKLINRDLSHWKKGKFI